MKKKWFSGVGQTSFDVAGYCVSSFESIDGHCNATSGNFHFKGATVFSVKDALFKNFLEKWFK